MFACSFMHRHELKMLKITPTAFMPQHLVSKFDKLVLGASLTAGILSAIAIELSICWVHCFRCVCGTLKGALAVMILICLLAGAAMADVAVNFEDDAVGLAPKGWSVAKTGTGDPKWAVEQYQSASSKLRILKQSGVATYPLLLKSGSSIQDGFVEVKFMALAGAEDRAAGLVWRATDANNYYVVRANALENNVVLYKTVDGNRSSLEVVGGVGGYGVNVPVPSNQWHILRVEFKSNRFKVSFNGKHLFEVEDATFSKAGMVGLWTKADSVMLFDNISYSETK
jgi:hypothetical protein